MKFNIFCVLGLIAVQVLSAAKLRDFPTGEGGFPPIKRKSSQAVFMNNNANASGTSMAVNAGFLGDANAFTSSNAANYNMINQSS